jgi:hypothetical protein
LTHLLNEIERLRTLIDTVPGRLGDLSGAVNAVPNALLQHVDASTTRLTKHIDALTTRDTSRPTADERTIEALLVALREAQEGALYRFIRAHRQVAEDRQDRDDPAHLARDWDYIDQLLGPRPEDWPR